MAKDPKDPPKDPAGVPPTPPTDPPATPPVETADVLDVAANELRDHIARALTLPGMNIGQVALNEDDGAVGLLRVTDGNGRAWNVHVTGA